MRRFALIGSIVLSVTAAVCAGEIDFVEDFALAADRSVPLKQLIPGTEDFYYYHGLHFLNTEQFEKARELFGPWVQRHGQTPRFFEIRTRYALLTYTRNPAESLEYLKQRLGVTFLHQKEELNAEPKLPTTLDPALISRTQFLARANAATKDNIDGFEDAAFDWLLAADLTPNQRRSLLSRLTRPDAPGLVKAVADDLAHVNSGGFGSLGIHRLMLLSQLDELAQLKPALLSQQKFVVAYLAKLQPGDDEDWQHDDRLVAAHLARLSAFAARLPPTFNSLKAHVLYHQLVLDRRQGKYDRPRFLEYLKLPRNVPYASNAALESEAFKRFPCDLNATFDQATLLPPVGSDEPLVRSYLAHFLVEAANTSEFEPLVNDLYLRALFAETKIVNGLGESEQWASLLTPEAFRQLKERIDIDFAFTNKTEYDPEAPVVLDLHVKNVSTLIVKVYEINTGSYYREQQREIDTDVNLDGLVANFEQTHTYTDPPLRRMARRLEFRQLGKAGVYVIDFIGNGRSSRALIRKGRLHHLVETRPSGQAFTVFDGQGRHIKNASLWLAGHEYQAGNDGKILAPFSTNPGRQPIVLSAPVNAVAGQPAGETYSSLDFFQHEPENYELAAGFYVDREALLQRKTADLVIRPGLTVNGARVSIKLLEDVKLTATSTDLDGVHSTHEVPNFELFEDRETVYEFQTPPRLASISFVLSAKVKRLSTGGDKVDLSATDTFSLNEIDRTDKIEDVHLLQASGRYFLELRGKTGESRSSRPVVFTIKHRDFRAAVGAVLKTDPAGRIALGDLDGIAEITATGPQGAAHTWRFTGDRFTYPGTIQGRAGEPVALPFLPRRAGEGGNNAAPAVSRDEAALLELRGDQYVADRFANLSVKNGLIIADKLPAGDYELFLKSSAARIRIRLAAGERLGRFVMGAKRQLETPALPAVQIASLVAADGKLRITLANASKFTRVHLFAARFLPEYDAFVHLSRAGSAEPFLFINSPAPSVYLTGRNIGDEYRYIIDRLYATKFPGNMLDRPSLLLNPWAVRTTETGEQLATGGEDFNAAGGPAPSQMQRGARPESAAAVAVPNFANLDFLAEPAAVLTNLVSKEDGVIEIPLEALSGRQYIQVVAVDPLNTVSRTLTLAEQNPVFVDLRLLAAFDPQAHFTRQKQISIVPAEGKFVVADVTTSKFEVFDSLARVYSLYATLNNDPRLAEFAFIVNWRTLKPTEKQTQYSKHACHELNYFLFRKDREFFQSVVKPYLANKKDKTFLDRFLLSEDLADFLHPWQHGQLNIVEQILLAQRVAGEQARTVRHLGDLFALLPPDIDRLRLLFDTAVQANALNAEAEGLSDLKLGIEQQLNEKRAYFGARMGGLGPQAPGAAGKPEADAAEDKSKAANGFAKKQKSQAEEAKAGAAARDGRALALRRKQATATGVAAKLGDQLELLDRDMKERGEMRHLYRQLDKTWEWAENNYHHLTIDQQVADLISVNAFWNDYARHNPAAPFLSTHLAEASRNFSELMFALAVLDLPFESPNQDFQFEGVKLTLTAKGPLVLFHEQVQPAAAPDAGGKVLVSQNYFRHGDRQRMENGEPVDKFVTEEFLVQTVYGCQIVVTNPTSSRQKLDALLQIPRGAVPVLAGQATKTVHLNLEPYHTQTLDYYFYFPVAGSFTHFPVQFARNETLIAAAPPATLVVVNTPTKVDAESWDFVSQQGGADDVLRFLETHNVNGLNLERIAWRMHDAKMFAAVVELLARRHVYQHTLWSYALVHNSVAAAREYLQHSDHLVAECGGRLVSPLLTIDPVTRRTFEHLEYKPLVNARAHALGKRRQIVNDRLFHQYHRFLTELAHSRQLIADDQLAVVYYLLLQDRIEEAVAAFGKLNAEDTSMKMQYDYCAAYVDFFTSEHARARAIAVKYAQHPVERWRKTFAAIVDQLDEAAGGGVKSADPEDRSQQQGQLAASEPSFDFAVESRQITLNYQNLKTVRVNFYEMDVELLFSRNPFVQQFGGQFGAIRPNRTLEVQLPEKATTHLIPLPASLANKNVLVEIQGGGETKTQPYYSHALVVQVIENYGQVKVTRQKTNQPEAKVYVKVYAQTANGQVKFYKDGYTDLRGRFDYASLNTNDLDVATRFSILVLSNEHGALVREASPPKR